MNTLMWENSLTARHLRQLAEDAGAQALPVNLGTAELIEWINENCARLKIVSPVSKKLACEDIGMGAMAERGTIIETVLALF